MHNGGGGDQQIHIGHDLTSTELTGFETAEFVPNCAISLQHGYAAFKNGLIFFTASGIFLECQAELNFSNRYDTDPAGGISRVAPAFQTVYLGFSPQGLGKNRCIEEISWH